MNNTLAQRLEARAFVIPTGAQKITCKFSGAVVYLYTNGAKPCAMGFAKSAARPAFRYTFQDDRRREIYVRAFLERRAGSAKFRAEQAQARAEFKHTLKAGDILYSTWGYEQTNCDFFQVTAINGKTILIRKIAAEHVESNGAAMTGRVIARKDVFTGTAMRKLVVRGNNVRIESFATASLWDGKPVDVSSYA